jgi:hypothetical protein
MQIDEYSFGKIVINGNRYTSDVIIYPDRVDPSWWRKEGHLLQEADLTEIVNAQPDLLIIGTGNSGFMKVTPSIINFLRSRGIEVSIEKTGKAVELFNKQPKGKKTIGAFHLTC